MSDAGQAVLAALTLALMGCLVWILFAATMTVTMPQMRAAVDLCRMNEGLRYIDPETNRRHLVRCKNGAVFELPVPLASKYNDPINRNPEPTTE